MKKFMKIKKNKLKVPSAWRFVVHQVGRDPWMDWLIIFIFSLAVSSALVVAGALSYIAVGKQLAAPAKVPKAASQVFDPAVLSRVLGAFSLRNSMRADLSKSYAGPADPSR